MECASVYGRPGPPTCSATRGLCVLETDGELLCKCHLRAERSTGTVFLGASKCPRQGSPPEMAHGGSGLHWPTSLAALQRLLVAQQQLHVEGVAVLPEGNPRGVGQPLGTAAVVAYSSGRRGPCGGCRIEEVARSPPWDSLHPAHPSAPAAGRLPRLLLQTAPCNLVSQLAVRQAPSTST